MLFLRTPWNARDLFESKCYHKTDCGRSSPVSTGMRTICFYVQDGMLAICSNRNVITRRTSVGPAQYQPECVEVVFTYRTECPRCFQIQPIINPNAYMFVLLTGRNAREFSKSPGGLGWPQPSINWNAYKLF